MKMVWHRSMEAGIERRKKKRLSTWRIERRQRYEKHGGGGISGGHINEKQRKALGIEKA